MVALNSTENTFTLPSCKHNTEEELTNSSAFRYSAQRSRFPINLETDATPVPYLLSRRLNFVANVVLG